MTSESNDRCPLAVVYCQGAFATTYGKTAHGLVRRSRRYEIGAVIDDRHAGRDAGEVLDGKRCGVPIVASLDQALTTFADRGRKLEQFIVGLAPDGGRLPDAARKAVLRAIDSGLNVASGLHDFLSEDEQLSVAAAKAGIELRDIRKPPPRSDLHFFSGKIEQVDSLKVALLGTDSAVGKRTTAWLLVDAWVAAGRSAELIGTGQTAWLQGARYSIVLDSLVNDFVSGEIEHTVFRAWEEQRPELLVLEGQGSLMNPAYPGGYELLAAGRPDLVVLQHAPARREYDGFPGYPIQPIRRQIEAVELISNRPVVAIAINSEDLDEKGLDSARKSLRQETGLPVLEPLRDGVGDLVALLQSELARRSSSGGPRQSGSEPAPKHRPSA